MGPDFGRKPLWFDSRKAHQRPLVNFGFLGGRLRRFDRSSINIRE